jgi:hypothetical protein
VPLSFGQQRMWFLNRLEDTGAVYNIPLVLRLTGALDVAALEAALGDVASRHESLRTVFPDADGVLRAVVLDPAAARPVLAVTAVSEQDLAGVVAVQAARGFDLGRERPWRASLFPVVGAAVTGDRSRTGVGEADQAGAGGAAAAEPAGVHVLLLVVHHIAADGWSVGVLGRDLSAAYTARAAGQAPGWAPLPVQYADYTLWQRELLGDEDDPGSLISTQLGYWRETLAGIPEDLALPVDRPRPATPTFRGGVVPVGVGPRVHTGLAEVARQGRATLFMGRPRGAAVPARRGDRHPGRHGGGRARRRGPR